MGRACVLFRRSPSYRADAFRCGLERHGFTIEEKFERRPRPGDLLVLWNRTRAFDSLAVNYERHGATVLVAENGYLGTDRDGAKLYALARNFHNGKGEWHVGAKPRRTFDCRPWRQDGDHVLVLPQRGIGVRGVAMPATWQREIMKRLTKLTDRPVRIRPHPGANRTDPWPDLEGAWCAVTWGSGAALKAICHGIPVFHDLEGWIGAPAARHGFADLDDCYTGDRGAMLHRLSWAQWSAEEIKQGEAFEGLLRV